MLLIVWIHVSILIRAFRSERSEKLAKIRQIELFSRAARLGSSHTGWTHGHVPNRVDFTTCIPNVQKKNVIFKFFEHSKVY